MPYLFGSRGSSCERHCSRTRRTLVSPALLALSLSWTSCSRSWFFLRSQRVSSSDFCRATLIVVSSSTKRFSLRLAWRTSSSSLRTCPSESQWLTESSLGDVDFSWIDTCLSKFSSRYLLTRINAWQSSLNDYQSLLLSSLPWFVW